MPKDARLRRIEQAATVGRGSVVTAAATSSPATPAPSTAAPALVGQALTDGKVLIGDSASLAAEQAVSGDATVNRLGVLTLATVTVAKGGTGQTSYTNGQLLIGNTTGNTLTKATLTAGTGVTVTNGTGTITLAIGQAVGTGNSPTFAALTSSGRITITDGALSAGLLIGADVLLYRSDANLLRTPDAFIVDGYLGLGTTVVPAAPLHATRTEVAAGSYTVGGFGYNNSFHATFGYVANGTTVTHGYFRSANGLPVYFGTSTSPTAIEITDGTGFVGLGGTATVRLTVRQDGAGTTPGLASQVLGLANQNTTSGARTAIGFTGATSAGGVYPTAQIGVIQTPGTGLAYGSIYFAPVDSAGSFQERVRITQDGGLGIADGITAPATLAGFALLYVDSADGDLKVKFGDGTVKTIVTDT